MQVILSPVSVSEASYYHISSLLAKMRENNEAPPSEILDDCTSTISGMSTDSCKPSSPDISTTSPSGDVASLIVASAIIISKSLFYSGPLVFKCVPFA